MVTHVLLQPIIARYVQIKPKTWNEHISMRAEFYGCILSGKRTVNGHYLRGGGGKRDRKERGVGSRWLCDHQIYLISPSPRLYNIVMILSRWQSIFCNPPSLCWRRMIPPSYPLKTTRSPQITPRPSSLR